jgi:hypothetical protein
MYFNGVVAYRAARQRVGAKRKVTRGAPCGTLAGCWRPTPSASRRRSDASTNTAHAFACFVTRLAARPKPNVIVCQRAGGFTHWEAVCAKHPPNPALQLTAARTIARFLIEACAARAATERQAVGPRVRSRLVASSRRSLVVLSSVMTIRFAFYPLSGVLDESDSSFAPPVDF